MKNESFTLRNLVVSILLALAFPLYVNAQQIGEDEARQIAADFFAGYRLQHYPSKTRKAAMLMDSPELAYTAKTEDVADFYVFNNTDPSGGFVIVAGNHEQPDILGYSLGSTFDMESAPENFKWWMEQYQDNGTTMRKVTKRFWHDVEPLIKTKWGQEGPFNGAIPRLEGFQPFVTGCTATAIAQVMNYYKYPQKGVGSNSYDITYNGDEKLKVTFSADFEKTKYDWGNMLDDYSNGYTKTQSDAVATLVYHVGVAERTSYSDADHGSSASPHNGAMAMMEHFDYDQSMETANRKCFTDEDWEKLIYQELENERPVLYSGRDASNGGHSFIVHGYDAEKGLYAINWGWAGYCDGYYALTGANSLSPRYGDNYVGDRYNYEQTIYFNIKPNEGGQSVPIISTWDQVLMCTISSNTAINNYELDRTNDEDVTLRLQFTPWNSGLCSASFLYGIMFINRENGHTIDPDRGNVGSASLGVNKYYSYRKNMSFNTSMLQYNGVYEVWPAYSVDNGETWHPMPTDITNGMPTITVQGGAPKTAYTLTYLVDGEIYETQKLESGVSIAPEKEPAQEGYTFSGWSEIPETMPDKDVIVTGTFIPNKYTLIYVVDGEVYKSYDIEYGANITAEEEPYQTGCTFSGWSEIPATMPARDVTITGSFTVNNYTLTYQVDGEIYKTYEIEYGANITSEAEPTKEGYTFSGWGEIPATMPPRDVTITGSFAVNKYNLVYMVEGETYETYEVEYGTIISPEAEPTKEGYSFSGWSLIPTTMPAKDVIITGSFTKGQYKLVYMVDGLTYKTISFDYGDAISVEDAPAKEGYTFSGWSEIPATMPANDVTVTGSFTINKYMLTYQVDGETYKSYDIEYGASITAEEEPYQTGCTFSGWSEIPATMPARDVTITGNFTLIDAIEDITADDSEYQIYTIDGTPIETLQKGVNIIRYENGTTKSVYVK